MSPAPSLPENSPIRIPEHVLTRRAGPEAVVLNLDNEQYYGLDGVGVRVWELLETGEATVSVLVDRLLDEFAVERERLTADVIALLTDLERNGLVAVDEP